MKKKSILFMLINMNIGGTEKALLNMLEELPRDQFDITILMLERYGGFLGSIPKDVKVEYLDGYDKIKGLIHNPIHRTSLKFVKKGNFMKASIMAVLYFISKLRKEQTVLYKYALREHPPIAKKYEIAVAYAGPMDFISYFIVHKVNAEKKIQWIHFDICKIGFNLQFAKKHYKHYDQIFTVSKEGKKKLLKKLPYIKEKTFEFPNAISSEKIQKLAESGKGFEDEFDGFRILTVGRLSKEKGQDIIIPVLARLKEAGFRVRWYCIGEGSARRKYEQIIKEYQLEEDLVLLGSKSNPYPYMKQCDLYVQTSRHEGYCITLAEARCFDNPIITTNFTGAAEQITNEETGIITLFNEDALFESVCRIIENDCLRNKLKSNLQKAAKEASKCGNLRKLTEFLS
ncbi:glycosyltransferase [Siminovitchia sediminis]|uniref:Glycosyltransferase n=1 Tax=Siminovitchia sediminis TaxID=1274353 RepID=A0ABW4KCM5_9BACI